MNFTWFASAYDTDDVPYRLAVLVAFTWGYGHYFVFASAAAVGAGLVVAIEYQRGLTEGISFIVASAATTVPVAVYLIALGALHAHPGRPRIVPWSIGIAAVLVLVDTFIPAPLYVTAGVLSVLVAVLTVLTRAGTGAARQARVTAAR